MSHIEEVKGIKRVSEYLNLIRKKGYSKEAIIDILEEIKPFHKDYPINIEITEKGYPAYFNAYRNLVHISESSLKNYIDKLIEGIIKLYPNLEKQREELFAYTTLFILCHEIEHTYQFMFGERYLEPPYEVVGDAYKKLIEIKEEKMSLLQFRILLSRYKSQKDKAHFVLERNANVEAYDLLLKLSQYESNPEMERLMYNQLTGYQSCGYASLRFNGSFDQSFKTTWRKRKFEELDFSEDIPVDERIRYGLPISDEDRLVLLRRFVALKGEVEE